MQGRTVARTDIKGKLRLDMRIWVMENGLIGLRGHHLNDSLGLAEAIGKRGIEARFLVNQKAVPEVMQALPASAVFSHTPYDRISRDPLAGPLESFIVQANTFATGLGQAVEAGLGRDDLVLTLTTTQHELYGLAIAFDAMDEAVRPRLLINFGFSNFMVRGSPNLAWNAGLYRFAMRCLNQVTETDRLILTATGDGMAQAISQLLDHPVRVYPKTSHYPFEDRLGQPPPTARRDPIVAFLGASLEKKGFGLLPRLVSENDRLNWIIQTSPAESARRTWGDAESFMRESENVEIVAGDLTPSAYYDLLLRADIVLLPYDAAQMRFQDSGIFAEAVAAEKVLVVPDETWMSDHIAAGRGAGTIFRSHDSECISSALRAAVEQLPSLRARASSLAPEWRKNQSMSAYLDRALQDFGIASGRGAEEIPSVKAS
jgi:hypothetical protein